MKLIAAIASLLLIAASPPPPPPEAPEIAQGEFDGYPGPDLWRAWQRTLREAAIESAGGMFEMAETDVGDDFYLSSARGPSIQVSTGYWNEGFRASFFQTCHRNQSAPCAWHYRSVRIAGSLDRFNSIAEDHFHPDLLARALRESGISPADFVPNETLMPLSVHASGAMTEMVEMTLASESDCPAVGRWRERLGGQSPIYLSGAAPAAQSDDGIPPPPPPPYPIHIRHVIEIPTTAFAGAEVMIRLEDTRNRQLDELWQTITGGISACTTAE